jgi:hypothetical protein
MIDAIGGRKVAGALLVIAIGVGVVFLKGDIPPNLMALLQVVFGAFVAGNAVEHMAAARKPAESLEVSNETSLEPGAITELQAPSQIGVELAEIKGGIATVQQTLVAIIEKAWGKL